MSALLKHWLGILQSLCGYGSAILVRHCPSAVIPESGRCDFPECLHTPRFEPMHRKLASRSRLRWIPKKPVDLRHGFPNMQYSTSWNWVLRRRITAAIGGHIQRRDLAGFSSVKAMITCKARFKTLAENRIRMLPIATLRWSCGRRLGRPKGCWSLRKGGGPPGWSLARDIELQGVPRWPARKKPDCIQPKIFRWFSNLVRS